MDGSSRSASSCSSAARHRLKLTRTARGGWCANPRNLSNAIDIAEDRQRFDAIAREVGVEQPPNGLRPAIDQASTSPTASGIRCFVRRRTCSAAGQWRSCTTRLSLVDIRPRRSRVGGASRHDRPVPEDAFEADVDALCDGNRVVIGGIISTSRMRAFTRGIPRVCFRLLLGESDLATMWAHYGPLARALGAWLINVQSR